MAGGEPPPPPEVPARPGGGKKTLVLVIVALLVIGGLVGVTYYILSQPPPPPAVSLQTVTITGATSMDQAALLTLSATAIDTAGKAQTGNATWTWSASPAAAVQIRDTAVPSTKQVFAVQSGSVTITASATWTGSSRQGTHAITISPLSFELTPADLVPLVGEPFDMILRVNRADASLATAYAGTVRFTSTDPGATLPADYTFSPADAGARTFTATVSQSGSVTITVVDTVAAISGSATVTGNRAPTADFTITPDSQDPLIITADGRASSDPDGDALTYDWDFGDGGSATTAVATHTYAQANQYTIRLTVADVHGVSDFAEQTYEARSRPVASFVVQSVVPVGPDIRVTVDATASADADGTIVNYNWTWGDGNFTDTPNPVATHDYAPFWHDKTVTIVLNVTDDDGLYDTESKDFIVTVQPLPPVAVFVIDNVDQETRTVFVDASGSTDPNLNIMWYNWSWGDGEYDNITAPTTTASHKYAADGTYTITLTVIDSTNLKDSFELPVTVQQPPRPPTAVFTVDRNLMRVNVDGSASFDPNDDPIVLYEWDFTSDGNVDATGATASHTYLAPGKYTITLVVTDPTDRRGSTTRIVSVANSTLDYRYYDFFDIEYGEWWDYRYNSYGDLPIDAECFNRTSIADGICVADPNNAIPDYAVYPYTNWYPLPGNIRPGNPNNNPLIYAPYRLSVTGVNVSGYNLSEPVFLPVFNYGAPRGDLLDFKWYLQYLDKATNEELWTGKGCPGINPRFNDGFYVRSQIWLTLDLAQSKRIFGIPVGNTAAQAQTWWNQNTDNACGTQVGVETQVNSWFETLGGTANTPGKYDIVNSFEYQYTPFYTNITARVDTDTGITQVYVEHAAWGTEVLLARMFYWGNASYLLNYLDSTKARGWWGMENSWFEDMWYQGNLTKATFNFTLDTVLQYQFQHLAFPGPDGLWNRVNDVPYWTWGPILTDYTNDYSPKHLASELDRYPNPPYRYTHTTPGSAQYNKNLTYDYVPIAWDLSAGQTWNFEFPSGDVVFYDPNNTPLGADPRTGAYVTIERPLSLNSTQPANYGRWDAANFTWAVYGPSLTGGKVGSPGPDGQPGTADDQYVIEPFGAIRLVPGAALAGLQSSAPLQAATEPDVAQAPVASTLVDDAEASAGPYASAPNRLLASSRSRWE